MSGSVVTSITANTIYSSYSKNNRDVQESLLKIGTGLRVSSAKDDAASSAIASGMTAELGAFEKAHLNTSQAGSLLKTMESGVEQVTSMVQRIEALAIQSQSSALSNKNRATLQNEVSGLIEQMGKIVNTTNFNGVSLLNGSKATTAYNPFTTLGAAIPTSNVFPEGLSYSFDSSVNPTAIEVVYTADTASCNGGTVSMMNLETGTSQELAVNAPFTGSNSYYFDQLGASITIDSKFASESFAYGLNTATTPGTGKILDNSSGDINCLGVTTTNNNIAITQTTGMINDIASTTVTISGATAKSATFTLPAHHDDLSGDTKGDFVANNIDLSTIGEKEIVLSRSREVNGKMFSDSITLQLTVTTAFTAADISSTAKPSTVDVAQLQNIVIADSEIKGGSTLSFQVNTSAIGVDSDSESPFAVPSISASSLGIDTIDVTQTDKGSENLHKIRNALTNLDQQRANVGVAQGQIEVLQHNLEVSMENSTAARSGLIDLDFAKGVLELTNSTVRMQASQQALSRANSMQDQLIQLLAR